MAVQLHLVEPGDVRQQRPESTPTPQQGDGAGESDTVIQLGQANHVAATAAPVAVEQIPNGIYQKTQAVIVMQRAQPHQSARG